MPRLLDLPQGERKSLAELKKMAQDDPELQPENISEERKQELIDDLMEARGEKKSNARGSNRAAACDVQATIDRVTDEVSHHTFDDPITALNDRCSLTRLSFVRDFVFGYWGHAIASTTSPRPPSLARVMQPNSSPRC